MVRPEKPTKIGKVIGGVVEGMPVCFSPAGDLQDRYFPGFSFSLEMKASAARIAVG
jgi:hypothetical protein